MAQPASPKVRLVVAGQAAYVAAVTNLAAGVSWVQNIGHTGNVEVLVATSAPADTDAGTVLAPGQSAAILNNAATGEVYVKSEDETTAVHVEVRYASKQPVLNNLS